MPATAAGWRRRGKSTTIRVLLGLLRSDGGSARSLGGDPWSDAVELHRRLAYVPGDVTLWPTLNGGETIDMLGGLRGASIALIAAGLAGLRRRDITNCPGGSRSHTDGEIALRGVRSRRA